MTLKTQRFIDKCNEAFHRHTGSPIPDWKDILPVREAKRVCLGCRKVEMQPRQQYCPKCYQKHRNQQRRSNVAELANSPIRAQALT